MTRPWIGRSRELSSVTGRGNFFFCNESRPAVGSTQPPFKSVLGAFPDVKSSEREADHSPSSSAEVKKAWSFTVISGSINAGNFWAHSMEQSP